MTVIFRYFDSLYCKFLVSCRFLRYTQKNVHCRDLQLFLSRFFNTCSSQCMKDNCKSALQYFDLLFNSASSCYFILFVFPVSERTEPNYFMSAGTGNENEERVVLRLQACFDLHLAQYTFTICKHTTIKHASKTRNKQ